MSVLAQVTADLTTGDAVIGGAGIAMLVAFTKKLVDFVKYASNWKTHQSGVITQLIVWAGVIGIVFLWAESNVYGASIPVAEGVSLATADGWTKIIFALGVGSGAGVLTDLIKARDDQDTAAVPRFPVGDRFVDHSDGDVGIGHDH